MTTGSNSGFLDVDGFDHCSYFLVSLSNQAPFAGRPVLLLVDTKNKNVSVPLDLAENTEVMASSGGAGICSLPSGYALLLQGYPCRLCFLRHDLSLDRVIALSKVEDGHSITWHNGSLLVVSTETNSVVEIDSEDRETVVTYYGNPGSKSEHLNGIAIGPNGHIILSGFGNRQRSGGQGARNGFIRDITSGEVLISNLREPHSVQFFNRSLFTLESQTGNLVRMRDRRVISCFRKFYGYVRGLALSHDGIVVGQSALRLGSRHTVERPRKDSVRASEAGIHIVAGNTTDFMSLKNWANEVYDIIPFKPLRSGLLPHVVDGERYDSSMNIVASSVSEALSASSTANRKGNDTRARDILKQALVRFPASPALSFALGNCCYNSQSWAEAEQYIVDGLAAFPRNLASLQLLSRVRANLGNIKESLSIASEAVRLAPRSKAAHHYLADILVRDGNLVAAEQLLRALIKVDPEGDATQRKLAAVLYHKGAFDEALIHASRAIDLRPDAAEYYEFAAKVEIKLGKPEKAESLLHEAVEMEPATKQFYSSLEDLLVSNKYHDAKLKIAQLAWRNNKEDLQFGFAFFEALMAESRFAEAADFVRSELGREPRNERLHHALSRALSKLGDEDGALKAAQVACVFAPHDPHCLALVAYLLSGRNALAEAAEHFRAALAIKSNMPEVWVALADTLARMGAYAKAIEAIEHAIKLTPNDLSYVTKQAEMFLKAGDAQSAEQVFRRLLAQSKQPCAKIFHGLARALSILGRQDDALQAAEEACNLDPENEHCLALVASLDSAVRNLGAEPALNQALSIEPMPLKVPKSSKEVLSVSGSIEHRQENQAAQSPRSKTKRANHD